MPRPATSLVLLAAAAMLGLAPALAQQATPLPPAGQGAEPQAQSTAGPGDEAEELGLTGPEVQQHQPQGPTDQGMLAPDDSEGGEGADTLYSLLTAVWNAPPALDGTPIPRPNELASQPETEMEPLQPEDASLFPEGYVE